jgi:CBS domain-containing protein
VREAAELIIDFKLDGVPVIAAGATLLGLVTATELVRLLANPPNGNTRLMVPPAQ